MITYDKMRWYTDTDELFRTSRRRMRALMEWLKTQNLLTSDGIEIFLAGIDADFGIDEIMLTAKGNELLSKHYKAWLDVVDPIEPDATFFEQFLE